MTDPHDATQSFPAGGAPPPPPSPAPAAPGVPAHDATQAFPVGGAPPAPSPEPARPPSGPGAQQDVTRVSGDQGPFAVPGAPAPGPAPGYAPAPAGYGPPPGYGPSAGYGAPPPASPHPSTPAPTARKGRIVGRALLVLVVIAALAATTAWGFVNRSSAAEWRDRSETADAALTESLDRLEATSSDLEDARTRLRDLANENASETDRNVILSDILAQAPEVTAALADCQQMTAELANDIIALLGDPEADVSGLQERTDEVNEVCASALDEAEALEDAIEGLGG